MQPISNFEQAKNRREMAYFKGELAVMSPESYTMEEKQGIILDMLLTDLMVDEAMKNDFWQLPEEIRPVFFRLLVDSGEATEEYWRELLQYWD